MSRDIGDWPGGLSWDVSEDMGNSGGCHNCFLWSDWPKVSMLPHVLGAHPTLCPVTAATFNPLPSVGSRINKAAACQELCCLLPPKCQRVKSILLWAFPSVVLGKQAKTGLVRLNGVTSWPLVRTFPLTLESPGRGGRTICLVGGGGGGGGTSQDLRR